MDRDHIENTFLDYFSNLWEEPKPNSFSFLLHALPQDLNSISASDCVSLTKKITKEEVFTALNSLEEGKSPGPDGFNVEFFKFFWEDIGDPLFLAIKHFFTNVSMPNSWGKTFVT